MESVLPEQPISHAEVSLPANPPCKKVEVEDSDVSSIDEQDDSLPRPVRKKRPNRRYAEWSSDDEYCLRALKRPNIKYKEPDSSSESESEFIRPARDSALKPTGLPIGVVRGCPKCSDCQAVLARWRPEEGCKPSIDAAPVFYPTEEEFKDTLKYIAKIRPSAEPFGICRVVPPPGWRPPCPLREDVAKLHVLKFPTRVQEIHKLQVRQPVRKCSQARSRLGGRRGRGGFRGRMGRPCRRTPSLPTSGGPVKSVQPDESFGFEPGSYFSLGMFEKYAQQFKEQYFVTVKGAEGLQAELETKHEAASNMNPSVDAIEAEYWRIVEKPTEQIEVLYGADVETGSFGSGFPKAKAGDILTDGNSYEKSGWNLNNIARLPGSMLAFEEGDISGVLVPWLYVGMCFSSFCWHVEDHHFYSLNYLHWGAPKVWYGVAGRAAHNMEAVMKKHLPELFDEQPDLLHKLVTQLSPSILKEEGLPVYRLVQHAGEFVITFPRAYHSGFNCGFNCAEAVNLAPVDWLPHGQSAVELYMEQRRKTSVSHDKLLFAAARHAIKVVWQSGSQESVAQPQGQAVKQERHEESETSGVHGDDKDIANAWRAYCGPDGVLVKALKARVKLEQTRRRSLSGELQTKKMDRWYDATDERECAECHYDLHLSAVGCGCCPDKYVCLSHAPLLCGCQWGRKYVMYRYDIVTLELLVAALEGQPGALRNWFEVEKCLSPADSVSMPSTVSQPCVENAGIKVNLGPCGFNSAEFQFRTGFKGQNLEPKLASHAVGLASRPGMSLKQSFAWEKTPGTVPLQHSLGSAVNKNAPAQPLFYPAAAAAAGVDARETRGQSGISEVQRMLQTMEKKIDQLSSSSKEVIVLSDDEEGALTRSRSAVSSLGKVHEGNSTILHSPSNYLDSGRAAKPTGPSTKVMDVGVTEKLPDDSFLRGSSCALGRASLQRGLSAPISPSTQLPGSIVTPPLNAEAQSFVASPAERPVVSSLPTRLKSIGSLKQQARAGGSSQHLGSVLRQAGSRADHLQRLQNSPEVSGAELCGHVPTPDTVPTTLTQDGNVQSRTPVRGDRTAGPRVAKVLRKKGSCDVELLNVGSLVYREGWHTKNSIFPSGFKSRTTFCNVFNISQTCSYVSEIVECGQSGPRYKVSVEGNSTAVFVDDSIDRCWQAVQERVNEEIIRRRGLGETNLPSLQPPQSLHGLDMFGLTSATIVQAVEALDPLRKCSEYWNAKLRHSALPGHPPAHAFEHHPTTSDDPHLLGTNESGANVEVISRPTTPSTETLSRRVPVEYPSRGNVDLYGVLKGFFQRGKAEELWALHQVFSCDWQGKEWREGFQALTDVLDTTHPP
ncbi:unnamed protein product [Calypogeia fissa]